jgi:hypothetical protein
VFLDVKLSVGLCAVPGQDVGLAHIAASRVHIIADLVSHWPLVCDMSGSLNEHAWVDKQW